MTVDTRQVANRRKVQYANLDEFLADAEQMGRGPAHTVGNWTIAQIFDHLAKAMNTAVDGPSAMMPLPLRLVIGVFKKRIISRPLSPGFKLPKKLNPIFMPSNDAETHESLQKMRDALSRFRQTRVYGRHPAFGRLTAEQWNMLTLNHNALHMSFIVPD